MATQESTVQNEFSLPSLLKGPVSDPVKPIDEALPTKSAADFYGYGDIDSPRCIGSPFSLNRMMAGRNSLKAVHCAFVLDLEKRREKKSVSFGLPDVADYGYGDQDDSPQEPPNKRRRYQRRNSKTPAMLMQMKSTLMSFDFSKLDEECHGKDVLAKPEKSSSDDWDGGIEIAEELVMHLQSRRKNLLNSKLD